MLREIFLVCALALPSPNFTRPPVVSYEAVKTEQEILKDLENWIRKINPGCDVFIHQTPQVEKLREYGWERFPANWKDFQIWIRRKPVSDKRGVRGIESSA